MLCKMHLSTSSPAGHSLYPHVLACLHTVLPGGLPCNTWVTAAGACAPGGATGTTPCPTAVAHGSIPPQNGDVCINSKNSLRWQRYNGKRWRHTCGIERCETLSSFWAGGWQNHAVVRKARTRASRQGQHEKQAIQGGGLQDKSHLWAGGRQNCAVVWEGRARASSQRRPAQQAVRGGGLQDKS